MNNSFNSKSNSFLEAEPTQAKTGNPFLKHSASPILDENKNEPPERRDPQDVQKICACCFKQTIW
jgi:hypothetical protein